jgi:hypothetical protein
MAWNQRYGLQRVDVETGQCTWRDLRQRLHIINLELAVAVKVKDWMDSYPAKRLGVSVPELTEVQVLQLVGGI